MDRVFNRENPPTFYRAVNTKEFVDKSQIAVCPFNRAHMVKKCRIQYHVVKCIKNYEGTKVPCPYNYSDYFEPHDLLKHLSVCPSRSNLETQRYFSDKNRNKSVHEGKSYTSVNTFDTHKDNRYSDENWGLE